MIQSPTGTVVHLLNVERTERLPSGLRRDWVYTRCGSNIRATAQRVVSLSGRKMCDGCFRNIQVEVKLSIPLTW